jgi:Fur family transcriptional regulator, peroxide stress response regulator
MDTEEIKQTLEGAGLRCTAQRYAVMSFLMQQNNHPTAVEIFEAVNRVDPLSSKATTYNNLRDLVQAGLVREVAVDIEWFDLPKPATVSLGKRIIRECELIFRGLCTKCAPKRASG